MAVVQTGSILTFQTLGSGNTGTVSSTITVPSDAELIVVGWGGYSNTANFFSSGGMTFTKGGVDTAMTPVSGGDSNTSAWDATLFYLALPDTGTNKTLKWDWAGTNPASDTNNTCSITFWKGVDTASPVRGSGGGQNASGTPYTSGTITAASGDLIVAFAATSTPSEGTVDSWSNLSLLAQGTNPNSTNDFAWATGSPSGNVAVAASTSTNWFDGGISAISIKPAASAKSSPVFRKPLRFFNKRF